MIRLLLVFTFAGACLALAEPRLEQNFDGFPTGKQAIVTRSALAGRWHGFGTEGNDSEIQSGTARGGNAIKVHRPDGAASPNQAIHAYFVPTHDSQITLKFWVYFEGNGSLRCALDDWRHFLAGVELGTSAPQVLDGSLGKWRKEAALALPTGTWHEIVIKCNRQSQTYSVSQRAENKSEPSVVVEDIPLNPNANERINVIEFHTLDGGPIYIDDLSIESEE